MMAKFSYQKKVETVFKQYTRLWSQKLMVQKFQDLDFFLSHSRSEMNYLQHHRLGSLPHLINSLNACKANMKISSLLINGVQLILKNRGIKDFVCWILINSHFSSELAIITMLPFLHPSPQEFVWRNLELWQLYLKPLIKKFVLYRKFQNFV